MNNISSKTINKDINVKEACLDILRDMYSASRQLLMYPQGHPFTNETLKKPISRLNEIFNFKESFTIQVYNNRIVAEGLLLEDNIFVSGLMNDFIKHNIFSIHFLSDIALDDLYHFLKRLIDDTSPADDYFVGYLKKKNVKTININETSSINLFDINETLIGSIDLNFMLNNRIQEIIYSDPDFVSDFYLGEIKSDEDIKSRIKIDFRLPFLSKHIAHCVSRMSEKQALDIFQKVIYSTNILGEFTDRGILEGISRLWRDYVGKNTEVSILLPVYGILKSVGATDDILEIVFDKGTLVKLKAVRDAEEIIDLLKTNQACEISFDDVKKVVFKLASDTHSHPLELLFRQLLNNLSSRVLDTRQRSLRLTIEAVQTISESSFWEIYADLVGEILRLALMGRINHEIVELIGWLVEKSAEKERWTEFKNCAYTLKTISGMTERADNDFIVSKLKDLSDSPDLCDILIDAVLTGKGGNELYESIPIISSDKLVSVLISRIDSSDKAIRTRVIKTLSKMGEGIGPLIIENLSELINAGEKDFEKNWYRLRNLLRVLGQIKYVEALSYFDILANWEKIQVKRELISACEKMESSATGVLLAKLATDESRDIRKAAIVAMGLSGHPDMLQYLRTIFNNIDTERELVAIAIGKIGGLEARDLLIDLYENPVIYKELNISKKDKQKIKQAILRSLSNIGDGVSLSKVELYSKKDKKRFFNKDILTETALNFININKK